MVLVISQPEVRTRCTKRSNSGLTYMTLGVHARRSFVSAFLVTRQSKNLSDLQRCGVHLGNLRQFRSITIRAFEIVRFKRTFRGPFTDVYSIINDRFATCSSSTQLSVNISRLFLRIFKTLNLHIFFKIQRMFVKSEGSESCKFLQTVLALVAGRTDRRHVVARDDDGRAEPRKARRYVFAGSLVAGLAKLAK